jgi:hypothetical protein
MDSGRRSQHRRSAGAEEQDVICERVVELLTGPVTAGNAGERREASEHAANCEDCRGAVMSVHALRLLSLTPVPAPHEAALDRAIASATAVARPVSSGRPARGFWLGMGLGAAAAASVAFAILLWLSADRGAMPAATPQLSLALNESQDISIALTTADALVDAEIHVTLSGSIGLAGFGEQKELMWHADLDAGANRLTLPIVATGVDGGQVLVEVIHDGKRRSFLVDVQARA